MTAGVNAAATAGIDGGVSLPDRFKIEQHWFRPAKSAETGPSRPASTEVTLLITEQPAYK